MKFIHFLFWLGFLQTGLSQSSVLFENSFTEGTSDQEKFSMYLDSIDKYLYRDISITELAMNECQNLIDKGAVLNDSTLFEFVLDQIYFQLNMANSLGAYQAIADNESLIDSLQISVKQKGSFNYLKGFTYMEVGDLEAAQKTYYDNLQAFEVNKDSATMISSLYSLGQLYNDENDFEAAIKCFKKILGFQEEITIRPSTLALINIELAECYESANDYDEAINFLEVAYGITGQNDLEVLKSEVLIRKGQVHLFKNELEAAQKIFNELSSLNGGAQDQLVVRDTKKFLADLYRAQKKYTQAISVYDEILENIDDTDLNNLMEIYEQKHELYKEMNDMDSAYENLLAFNIAKEEKDEDAKKQKTSYLKIKFNSEQKEKENAILNAKILQKRTESKLLYLWLTVSFLSLIILFGAFYNKGKYSKRLEKEVYYRTINLEKSNDLLNRSNKELNEFNRILSHDLKEPLRSIIGFSQLANRLVKDNPKAQEYLQFVMSSGNQLKGVIESVNLFQKTNTINTQEINPIEISHLVDEMLNELQEKYPNKKITLNYKADVVILNSKEAVRSVFQIILDNAAKYNEQEIVRININGYSKDKTHYFEIKDNGIGIAQDYHEHIFEMFKRLNKRQDYKGSGMGLSIAKKMIEKIGGNISLLQSEKNEGSTFLITLPESIESTVPVAYSLS